MPVPTLVSADFLDPTLRAGETSQVTFTFSEAVTGFDLGDLTAPNGTLSGLTTADNVTYAATFTPDVWITDATNVITVDLAGVISNSTSEPGVGTANSANYAIDTLAPTVAISSSTSSLLSGETAKITLTFSEAVSGFSFDDLSWIGGTVSEFSATANPLVYTAEFTPDGGVSGLLGSVSIAAGSYTDLAGNSGAGASSAAIIINTRGPTVAITADQLTLKADEKSSITFTFSDVPSGFGLNDIVLSGGTLSGPTNEGGGVYHAIFTPNSDVNAGVGSISVVRGSYTDGFGNAGGGAASLPITFDTLRPTLNIAIADTNLAVGEATQVTFTFSEAVTGFTLGDVTSPNATLSNLATSDNITYTATLTSSGATDTSNVITVAMDGVQDGAGNAGVGAVDSPNYALDGQRPAATIVVGDTTIKAGEQSLVTFTFSEAVTGFDNSDLLVANGTLSMVTSDDGGITWTATFTPSLNVSDTSNIIVLNNTGYSDLAGNAGIGTTSSNNYAVETIVPTADVIVHENALRVGQTSDVTITFSEAVSGLDSGDFTVENGALSNLSSADGGVTWTATLTPNANISDSGNLITLDMAGVTNAIGNAGVGATPSNDYAIDTLRPTATILVASTQLQAGQTSQVTITFSEAVTGFDASDLSVANGTLSGLSSADGGVTWTMTLTPTAGTVDATNLIVLDTSLVVDAAGNSGSGIAISNNYQVGYVPPPPVVSEDDVIVLPLEGGSVSAGPGDDSVTGVGGHDFIHGNTGDDTLIGGGGDDTVRGGQGDDFVHGATDDDVLFGDLGDDTVFGGQGDDFVQGGVGNDYVLGDLGRDTVLGGQGDDTVVGGDGDDYISGDLGNDVLVGGAGADLFNFSGGGGRDVVMDFSHAEGDQIRISPTDAADFTALSARFVEEGGNTVIELDGQTIVLLGVSKSALIAADFVFG